MHRFASVAERFYREVNWEWDAKMSGRIEADYLIDATLRPDIFAAALRAARVERVRAQGRGETHGVLVTLSWPIGAFGGDLVALSDTVTAGHAGAKGLLDLRLPDSFVTTFRGPKFGAAGTRALAGVRRGPLIGARLRNGAAQSAAHIAAQVDALCTAGIDLIRDDAVLATGAFAARARSVMAVIHGHADRTGKQVMHAFTLTGTMDQMRARHDLVRDLGGTCVMMSPDAAGMAGVVALGRHTDLPLHVSAAVSGLAETKLWRLAGADQVEVTGAQAAEMGRALRTPLSTERPCVSIPVVSRALPEKIAREMGHEDFIYLAGDDLLTHADGPTARVAALRDQLAVRTHEFG